MEQYIKILGTAGARFAVAKQLRSSAGTLMHISDKNIVLDPGPGTLVKLAESDPNFDINQLDVILLSHNHIDHSNDVNILIDGMTQGGLKRRGTLFAPRECIEGDNAVVFKYLRSFLREIVILEANRNYSVGKLAFHTTTRHLHGAETYGLQFQVNQQKVSFMVDTKYFPELLASYQDSTLLIMNVVLKELAKNSPIMHLSAMDAKFIIGKLQPKMAVLTHFGMSMLQTDLTRLVDSISTDTGVVVKAAEDGLLINLD